MDTIQRHHVTVSSEARHLININDRFAIVEEHNFLTEFYQCGLNDDDLERIQDQINFFPQIGKVVPVSTSIRDMIFTKEKLVVAIRYVYLSGAHTVLLITAYPGKVLFELTADEAQEIEADIERQRQFFLSRHTS